MPAAPVLPQRHNRLAESRWGVWTTQAHLIVTDPAVLAAAENIARDWLDAVDATANRFRVDSEVSRLARTGSEGDLVSPLLAELLRAALEAAAATDGDVDPTLGNALLQLGYTGRPAVPMDAPGVFRRPGYDWRSLRLDGHQLWLPKGLLLDLGATAKAHTADRVASDIARRLHVGVLLGLGGDLRIAGEQTPNEGWVIEVKDGDDEPRTTVRLTGAQAIATSSTLHRTWQRGGRLLHHILDPSTCQPAAAIWRTATVAADSCLWANTLSTACLVRGWGAPALIAEANVAARLVAADGSVHTLGGFPS